MVLLPVTFFYCFVAKDAVNASRCYLEKIFRRQVSWREIWKHFYMFAVVSVDRFYFVKGRYNKFDIEFHGEKIVHELLEKNKGCIILVSHIGSFDALRALGIACQDLPLKILMNHQHNPGAMKIIDALNPELAAAIVDSSQPPAKLALELAEHLESGGVIGIMADRVTKEEASVECDFLGGKARLPLSPWQLAVVLNVPVVLCFGLFDGGRKYSVYVELLSEKLAVKRSERKQVLAQYVQKYASRMEWYLGRSPFNWFNFYNYWQ
ncbi:MAG: hypothetical protein K6L76_05685 [Agarilytica sp.]